MLMSKCFFTLEDDHVFIVKFNDYITTVFAHILTSIQLFTIHMCEICYLNTV